MCGPEVGNFFLIIGIFVLSFFIFLKNMWIFTDPERRDFDA
jgi:hypothetical protein